MTTYKQKLRDPRWNTIRKSILLRDNYTCLYCCQDAIPMHVHHTYYDVDIEPWEYEEDSLITLCENCHEEHHRINHRLNKLITDSINKCGVDVYGKLYLAAAFQAKAIDLRASKTLLDPMSIFAVCLSMFEPSFDKVNSHAWDVAINDKSASSDELLFKQFYKQLSQENRGLVDGE